MTSEDEKEAIRKVMSILGSRKSKRKTEANRKKARDRWRKVREQKALIRKASANLTNPASD